MFLNTDVVGPANKPFFEPGFSLEEQLKLCRVCRVCRTNKGEASKWRKLNLYPKNFSHKPSYTLIVRELTFVICYRERDKLIYKAKLKVATKSFLILVR